MLENDKVLNYTQSLKALGPWLEEVSGEKEFLYAEWSNKYFGIEFLKELTAELSMKATTVSLGIDNLSRADCLALEFLKDLAVWYNLEAPLEPKFCPKSALNIRETWDA